MDGPQALLVGGPYDGTVVALPSGEELLVDVHLYESVDHWVEYRGQRVRAYVHAADCCGAFGGAEDECE